MVFRDRSMMIDLVKDGIRVNLITVLLVSVHEIVAVNLDFVMDMVYYSNHMMNQITY